MDDEVFTIQIPVPSELIIAPPRRKSLANHSPLLPSLGGLKSRRGSLTPFQQQMESQFVPAISEQRRKTLVQIFGEDNDIPSIPMHFPPSPTHALEKSFSETMNSNIGFSNLSSRKNSMFSSAGNQDKLGIPFKDDFGAKIQRPSIIHEGDDFNEEGSHPNQTEEESTSLIIQPVTTSTFNSAEVSPKMNQVSNFEESKVEIRPKAPLNDNILVIPSIAPIPRTSSENISLPFPSFEQPTTRLLSIDHSFHNEGPIASPLSPPPSSISPLPELQIPTQQEQSIFLQPKHKKEKHKNQSEEQQKQNQHEGQLIELKKQEQLEQQQKIQQHQLLIQQELEQQQQKRLQQQIQKRLSMFQPVIKPDVIEVQVIPPPPKPVVYRDLAAAHLKRLINRKSKIRSITVESAVISKLEAGSSDFPDYNSYKNRFTIPDILESETPSQMNKSVNDLNRSNRSSRHASTESLRRNIRAKVVTRDSTSNLPSGYTAQRRGSNSALKKEMKLKKHVQKITGVMGMVGSLRAKKKVVAKEPQFIIPNDIPVPLDAYSLGKQKMEVRMIMERIRQRHVNIPEQVVKKAIVMPRDTYKTHVEKKHKRGWRVPAMSTVKSSIPGTSDNGAHVGNGKKLSNLDKDNKNHTNKGNLRDSKEHSAVMTLRNLESGHRELFEEEEKKKLKPRKKGALISLIAYPNYPKQEIEEEPTKYHDVSSRVSTFWSPSESRRIRSMVHKAKERKLEELEATKDINEIVYEKALGAVEFSHYREKHLPKIKDQEISSESNHQWFPSYPVDRIGSAASKSSRRPLSSDSFRDPVARRERIQKMAVDVEHDIVHVPMYY